MITRPASASLKVSNLSEMIAKAASVGTKSVNSSDSSSKPNAEAKSAPSLEAEAPVGDDMATASVSASVSSSVEVEFVSIKPR
eukprot:CAMPEP_0170779878 /NCGR_PEP_ID=MMETSP0733-20121128/13235_1 /TAXON_ID=186038 /ORGANISM="Fragilariopsis kerguelensis, Strain L26-C5" /LENGTH=82 /DNA_ID=CAMNT_0011123549 /DNA_START=62 /DNA_END=310 /DNA_ORIENTATION=-